MDLSAIKAKIAKLLRLQQSSNAHEAANAAAFVEKLCREYGILPSEVSDEKEDNTPVHFITLKGKRINVAQQLLMRGVVYYYNGVIIASNQRSANGETEWHTFASEGSKIQIEIYFEYLLEQMDDFAEGAKLIALAKGQYVGRTFKKDFCKGFAEAVYTRLVEMKKDQQEVAASSSQEALAVVNRNTLQRNLNKEASMLAFPRQKKVSARVSAGYTSGAQAGRRAGQNVSLNQQVRGNNGPLRLAAAR